MKTILKRCIKELKEFGMSCSQFEKKKETLDIADSFEKALVKSALSAFRILEYAHQDLSQSPTRDDRNPVLQILTRARTEIQGLDLQAKGTTITQALRMHIAQTPYNRMGRGGERYRDFISSSRTRSMSAFRQLSSRNLSRLRHLISTEYGPFSPTDRYLFERIVSGPAQLVHYSENPNLDATREADKPVLKLFSLQKLKDQHIPHRSNTTGEDYDMLADQDFVFFSIGFGPPQPKNSRFGPHGYTFEVRPDFFRKRHVFASIGDSAKMIRFNIKDYALRFSFKIPKTILALLQSEERCLEVRFSQIDREYKILILSDWKRECRLIDEALIQHCFMEQDILPGIALLAVLYRREIIRKIKQKEWGGFTDEDGTPEPMEYWPELDQFMVGAQDLLERKELPDRLITALVNGVVCPIIKIPRFLITTTHERIPENKRLQ